MKKFKQFLIEEAEKSETLQRQIFSQTPSSHDNPLYNQIVTRPTKANFDWKDPTTQSSWADPRKSIIKSSEDGWDFSDVGSTKLADVKAKSPSYQAGETFKRYYSVKGSENIDTLKKFSAAMPDFHKRMNALADHFKTGFSYKVPTHAKTAAEHTDTLVLHHYDMPDSSLNRSIDATVRKWAKDNGIELLDRQGTDQGVDSKKEGSFSERMQKAISGGAKGSLAKIGQGIIDSSVAKLSKTPKQSTTQTLKNIGAAGLATASAVASGALTQGVQAASDVMAGLLTPPAPKDRMQVEKTFNSDIGLAFDLSPDGELVANQAGMKAVRDRQSKGVNFPTVYPQGLYK